MGKLSESVGGCQPFHKRTSHIQLFQRRLSRERLGDGHEAGIGDRAVDCGGRECEEEPHHPLEGPGPTGAKARAG